MRHWFSLSLLCCAQLLASGCADLNSPVIDYPGISTTAITPNTTLYDVSIAWNKATDGLTPQTALVYKVYFCPYPTCTSFKTIAEVEAGTPVATTTDIDINTATITGLTAGNAYFINVVVQDEEGNKAVYDPLGEFVHTAQVLYYPFSGNASDVVTKTTPNNLAVATGLSLPTLTLDRFGHVASAYNFAPTTTTSQCMQSTNLMSTVALTGGASRTVSFWVQSANTTTTSPRVPFAWGDGSASGSAYGTYETGTSSNWMVWLGGSTTVSTTPIVTTNWEHWVIGYDGADIFAYKNGSAVAVPPTNATLNTLDSLLYVGCSLDPASTLTLAHPYMGKIDDLRIFDVPLNGAAVTALYNATRP